MLLCKLQKSITIMFSTLNKHMMALNIDATLKHIKQLLETMSSLNFRNTSVENGDICKNEIIFQRYHVGHPSAIKHDIMLV